MQQGSSLQIGVGYGECDPAGSQQQQPLQSVHDELETSGPQLHVSALLPDDASPVPELDAPLDVPVLDVPVLLVPVLDVPVLLVPVLDVPLEPLPEPSPLEPEPASSFDEVPLPLLQAASPTVVDAPMTTTTWKSFSSFMTLRIPLALVRSSYENMSELEPEDVIRGTRSASGKANPFRRPIDRQRHAREGRPARVITRGGSRKCRLNLPSA